MTRLFKCYALRFTFGLVSVLVGFGLVGCGGKSNAVTVIAINPAQPNILFIATNDNVYKSRDDGATWVTITKGLSNARIISLAMHPANTATIYAGTFGDAVYRSTDGGNQWSIINAGMKEHVAIVNAFIFHPQNTEVIYAATTVGIFKTTDGGLLWHELPAKGMDSVYVVSVALDPNNTQILYAGTSGGVYKSADDGTWWRERNRGLIEGHESPGTALALGVNSLVMDPTQTSTLYIGTTRGAFKTADGGENWQEIQEGMGKRFVSVILIHPKDSAVLYASTQNGIYKSTDAGGHWTPMNHGLTNLNIRSLAMHPVNPDILYAGTQGGLFKTIQGGDRWTALTFRPLPGPNPSQTP